MWATIAIIIVLILAAMTLVLFEILTTTFGLLSTLTVVALGAAIWLASTISTAFAVILGIAAVVLLPPYVVLLVRVLPKLPIGRKLFLENVPDSTAAGLPATSRYLALVGQTGVAETLMRPAGAIRVGGERVQATAESGVIEKGAAVKVVAAGEQNIIVRLVDSPAAGGETQGRQG
jgi:membrane-bound serine protease (ClpP class)